MAMGIYSVLLSVFFAAAFVGVGAVVSNRGWRVAWAGVALASLLGVAPLVALFLQNSSRPQAGATPADATGLSLQEAWMQSGKPGHRGAGGIGNLHMHQ
jgi:hypothetical protein